MRPSGERWDHCRVGGRGGTNGKHSERWPESAVGGTQANGSKQSTVRWIKQQELKARGKRRMKGSFHLLQKE